MNNNCQNCGGIVLGNNILCASCVEEISTKKMKTEKEKKIKESWKNQWESLDDKPLFKNLPIKNPYSAAVIFHLAVFLIILVAFPVTTTILSVLSPFLGFLGDAAGGGLIVGLYLPLIGLLAIYFIRLLYFISLRISQGKPKKPPKP